MDHWILDPWRVTPGSTAEWKARGYCALTEGPDRQIPPNPGSIQQCFATSGHPSPRQTTPGKLAASHRDPPLLAIWANPPFRRILAGWI